jgi:hypothetical protein
MWLCRRSKGYRAADRRRQPVWSSADLHHPRRAAQAVRDALADTRVVLVNGARQAGKSTLVRAVAG